jgi:hypothetical protein
VANVIYLHVADAAAARRLYVGLFLHAVEIVEQTRCSISLFSGNPSGPTERLQFSRRSRPPVFDTGQFLLSSHSDRHCAAFLAITDEVIE